MPRPGCDASGERYSRHLPLLGIEGQKRLSRATAAVVGLGGLGSIVSQYLAAAGVGRLILIDGDNVEESNLNRQLLYDEASIGLPKPFLAARRIRMLNSCVEAVPVYQRVTSENVDAILDGADIVVDALDNWRTRLVLDEYTARERKPLVHGAVERFYGQVMLVTPESPRLKSIAPGVERKGTLYVIGPAVGVVASMQALLAIEAALGNYEKAGILYVIDVKTLEITSIRIHS